MANNEQHIVYSIEAKHVELAGDDVWLSSYGERIFPKTEKCYKETGICGTYDIDKVMKIHDKCRKDYPDFEFRISKTVITKNKTFVALETQPAPELEIVHIDDLEAGDTVIIKDPYEGVHAIVDIHSINAENSSFVPEGYGGLEYNLDSGEQVVRLSRQGDRAATLALNTQKLYMQMDSYWQSFLLDILSK